MTGGKLQTAKELLPWGALAAFTGAATFGELGPELRKMLFEWGPGLLIFMVIAQHVPALVKAQQRQADAIHSQAIAMQQQAGAMLAIAKDLAELPRRDELKFQDLMIGQELILKKLGDMEERLPR